MKTIADYPEILAQWHPTRNAGKNASDYSFGSEKKVWWKCPKGEDHEWKTSVDSRAKRKCPICAGKKTVASNSLGSTHQKLAKEWHPTRNGSMTPYEVMAGTHKKVWWQCKKGHAFDSSPNSRTNPQNLAGCPKCKRSKGEYMVAWHLRKLEVWYKSQFRFTHCKRIVSLPFDFVILPEGKTAGLIEYQGQQHYEVTRRTDDHLRLLERQASDQIKRDFCKSTGLRLLEIPYWRINDMRPMIEEFIRRLTPRVMPS